MSKVLIIRITCKVCGHALVVVDSYNLQYSREKPTCEKCKKR